MKTFTERLAEQANANGREAFPYGAPVARDAFAHVSCRGFVVAPIKKEFKL